MSPPPREEPARRPPRIDSHVHVGDWDHPDFLGRGVTLADTVATLRRSGLDGAVVMPTDRVENQALLEEATRLATPGGPSLRVLAWMRPGAAGRADLDFARREAGRLAGLKCHPSLSRVRISDEAFAPVLRLAAELDLPVTVHTGRWQEIAGWRHAVEAARAHPATRFVFAHAGGDTPPLAFGAAEAVRAAGLTNVWFEFCGLREYWVVERCVRLLGPDRYLMGSDFPLAHPLMYLGAVEGMDLPEADKDLLRGGNAVRLWSRGVLGGREGGGS